MAKGFLYLYSGGSAPQDEASGKAMMDAWVAYFRKLGSAIVDGGAPFAPGSKTIGGAPLSKATGYSIIQTDSLATAVALTEGHPHLAYGGGIEVFELVDMGGP
jgi:hypothetical protein